jgi:hypothetical protein
MPKPTPYLLFILLALALISRAQSASNQLEKIRTVSLQLKEIRFDQPLPFSSIQVVDSRPDTTKLGYGLKRCYYKVVVEGSTTDHIQHLLTRSIGRNFDPTAGQSLLVVIRHLWAKDLSSLEMDERNLDVNAKTPVLEYSECTAKLEVYAQRKNGYVPLFRVDSVFSLQRYIHKEGDVLLSAPFAWCLQKLTRLNYTKIAASAQRLTWEQIREHNARPLRHPIFSDTSRQQGIYLCYLDFLNNRVVKKEFVVESGGYSDELYVVENGSRHLLTDFWGFCDGSKLFIRQKRSFHELVRRGNTFEFIDDFHFVRGSGTSRVTGSNPTEIMTSLGLQALSSAAGSIKNVELKPCQLNPETGKPY